MLEGHTLSNLLLFGDLNSGSVAKGYRIDTPFLGTSSEETLNDWHDRIRVLLKNLGKEEVLHIHWRKDCDYFSALDGYGRESLKASEGVREYRQKREQHFRTRIEQKSLQRSELYIYASRGLSRRRHFLHGRKGLEKDFQAILDENQQHLSLWQDRIRNAFGNGTRVLEQTDADNHWLLRRILDPHTHSGIKKHILGNFDAEEAVEDNCVFTTGVTFEPSTTRFFFGGYYHSVFVMKKWPKVTFPGVIFDVLNQVPGLTVTVNIFSTESQREIELEKRQLKRLMRGRMESAVDFDKDIAIEKKQQKIRDLATGNVKTFSVEFLFGLREVTAERIAAAEEKFKNAILSLDGAELLEPDLKTTSATLFFHLFPGYITADREHSLCIYAQDEFLADMLPISTTFNGFLEDAEALYDGSTRNLVGVKTFERGTPQHSLLFGMTGAGKSVFMEDLLMQTMPYFDYTVILEEGLSYLNFTRGMGEEPIVFHPNFTEVLNVFDTFGLPLMPENTAFVATFVANLLGTTDDETYKLRVAQIAEYVQAVYGDKAKEWLKRHPEEIVRMKRLAYAVHCWQSEKNKENLLDAWISFQECGGENSTFCRYR
jgi:type IV secretory pathway VirB4 component